VTGRRIIDAILEGERDPKALAGLRHETIRATEETIVKSLDGNYRAEHLITLGQSLEGYRFLQQKMAGVDKEIEKFMDALPAKIDLSQHPLPENRKKQKRQHNAPAYDLRQYCYRAFGVDLTAIPGIAGTTAQVLLTEVGPDLSKFRSASAFANWLMLCPHNDISAVAHKIARIFYTLVTTGKAYDESTLAAADARQKSKQEANLRKRAHDLGFQLVPA